MKSELDKAIGAAMGDAEGDSIARSTIKAIDPAKESTEELRLWRVKVAESLSIRRDVIARASASLADLETLGANIDAELAKRSAEDEAGSE